MAGKRALTRSPYRSERSRSAGRTAASRRSPAALLPGRRLRRRLRPRTSRRRTPRPGAARRCRPSCPRTGVAATGIVADHAAQGAPGMGGRIGGQGEAVLLAARRRSSSMTPGCTRAVPATGSSVTIFVMCRLVSSSTAALQPARQARASRPGQDGAPNSAHVRSAATTSSWSSGNTTPMAAAGSSTNRSRRPPAYSVETHLARRAFRSADSRAFRRAFAIRGRLGRPGRGLRSPDALARVALSGRRAREPCSSCSLAPPWLVCPIPTCLPSPVVHGSPLRWLRVPQVSNSSNAS